MDKLLDGGMFFEGPRWRDGNWYVSDLYARHVLRVTVDGIAEQFVEVPNQPSGLGWLPDGSLVVVSMKDRRILRRLPDGTTIEHADLSPLSPYFINDMVVDGRGRAYVGTFGFDLFAGGKPEPGEIVRVDLDGSAHVAASGLRFPNGMAVTPDSGTLIVAECFGGRFTAFDIESDGALSGRRQWARLADAPSYESVETIVATDFAPDGCALDADGHIWVADALNGRVCRVAPGGEITDELRPPGELGLYACALGGHDGHTLLVCTAPSFAEHERKAAKEAELYIQRVDVPRAGTP
ncbi:gluconolactonase [Mycobacterium florentinum]|uniref:Gluconolactonase n=1 Tax=Mycobacterium florentinum TaxID=292462 RepID=A0A1X1U8L1_MYCFL|nr:SMP-30/gluconolactonase/LRE family protein [Mycobacterium florentinum]MCV7410626.1 SMP-30/gluconolactonase/LRE family protein [Mycobacterium florentinum]ORV53143.1 gluconolactonase [Mycobacterium florentinum]BBX79950.1 gluconolaconase [Mycobacterium florentinum]